MATTRLAQGTVLFLTVIIIITCHWLGIAGYLFLMTLWIWTIWVPLRDMDGEEEQLNLLKWQSGKSRRGTLQKVARADTVQIGICLIAILVLLGAFAFRKYSSA